MSRMLRLGAAAVVLLVGLAATPAKAQEWQECPSGGCSNGEVIPNSTVSPVVPTTPPTGENGAQPDGTNQNVPAPTPSPQVYNQQ